MNSWTSIGKRLAPGRSDVVAGLTGLLLGAAAGFGLIMWGNRHNPVIIYSAYQRQAAVSSGGHIDIVFNIDRLHDCPAQTSRWIWTWVDLDGAQVKQYFPLANTNSDATDAGDNQHFILSLELPADVWPGNWFYVSKTVENCTLFPAISSTTILETADIPIRIVAQP